MLSFYLDYYPGYRDESTMKVMRHESLGIYIFAKPKNQHEREYNDRMREGRSPALPTLREHRPLGPTVRFTLPNATTSSVFDWMKGL